MSPPPALFGPEATGPGIPIIPCTFHLKVLSAPAGHLSQPPRPKNRTVGIVLLVLSAVLLILALVLADYFQTSCYTFVYTYCSTFDPYTGYAEFALIFALSALVAGLLIFFWYPGPPLSLAVKLTVLWVTMFAVLIIVYNRIPLQVDLGAAIFLLFVALVASLTMGYAQMRFGAGRSTFYQILAATGYPVGDTEPSVRPPDLEERAAYRDFRRGTINRLQFMRIMALRHFVHGEINRAEYHSILWQIAEGAPPGEVASAPSPQPPHVRWYRRESKSSQVGREAPPK